jgi:glycosyltransferase involved in cell wall biosynthesis
MTAISTTAQPLVTVVVPVFNDEATIRAALESALGQTLAQIEIVVVDDASTDRTPEIVAEYTARDARVRFIRQPENMSAFQARRAGIFAARAPYVIFLDGDDELDRCAAETSLTEAEAKQADLVQFGIEIIYPDGTSGSSWEMRIQPKHAELVGESILTQLFPAGAPAAGQLWKYLFRTEVLRAAYEQLPANARFYRANDFPVAFLAAVAAKRYVSIPAKLYRYFWRRGASTLAATSVEAIDFQISAIDSFDSTTKAVHEAAYRHSNPQMLLDSHASARATIVGNVMKWMLTAVDPELFGIAVARIRQRVGKVDMVRLAARYQPSMLDRLAEHGTPVKLGERPVRSILITTATLTTGGISNVVLAQARVLAAAGHRVTIAVRRPGSDKALVPEGVAFYEVTQGAIEEKLDTWARICTREEVDVIIDHRVLYSKDWHPYVLMADALGIPTIGWIHNFAGRPTYDLSDMHGYLKRALPSLAQVVTLSPLDVVFWKLRGIERTAYLPNPPSPMLLEHSGEVQRKPAPVGLIELVWIGRMEQHTKQVQALLSVAAELRKLDVAFRLRVIGPDQKDYTAARFNAAAEKAGLADQVKAIGPLHGKELLAAMDEAHAFVGTSIIEGNPLTITEAQSRGLPVFMYEMPWLVPVRDNGGVVSVPQGDAAALARSIAQVAADPEQYKTLSLGALEAARRVFDFDFATTYRQLISGELPAAYSPEPTLDDAAHLLGLTIFFTERHAGIRQKLDKAEQESQLATRDARLALEKQRAEHESQVQTLPKAETEARKFCAKKESRIRALERAKQVVDKQLGEREGQPKATVKVETEARKSSADQGVQLQSRVQATSVLEKQMAVHENQLQTLDNPPRTGQGMIFKKANGLMRAGAYAEAIAGYKKVGPGHPMHTQALFNLRIAEARTGVRSPGNVAKDGHDPVQEDFSGRAHSR